MPPAAQAFEMGLMVLSVGMRFNDFCPAPKRNGLKGCHLNLPAKIRRLACVVVKRPRVQNSSQANYAIALASREVRSGAFSSDARRYWCGSTSASSPESARFTATIRKSPHAPHVSANDANHLSRATLVAPGDQSYGAKKFSLNQSDGSPRRKFLNSHPTIN